MAGVRRLLAFWGLHRPGQAGRSSRGRGGPFTPGTCWGSA